MFLSINRLLKVLIISVAILIAIALLIVLMLESIFFLQKYIGSWSPFLVFSMGVFILVCILVNAFLEGK